MARNRNNKNKKPYAQACTNLINILYKTSTSIEKYQIKYLNGQIAYKIWYTHNSGAQHILYKHENIHFGTLQKTVFIYRKHAS